MKLVIAALIVCLVVTSFAAATQPEWVTFNSPEGRFSIQFPQQPRADVQELDVAGSKIPVYVYTAGSSTVSYVALFADYPSAPEEDRLQRVLDALRDDLVVKLEARLNDESKITVDGNAGRQFLMTKTDGSELIYQWRAFVVGRRMYQVAASYYKRDSKSRELPKYFDSFHLLN